MATCAEVLALTLKQAGITRLFGLPGGEILDFIEAARQVGLEFVLTRHEATASLMADVTGQMQGRPGVCVSTLGPGAVNMTLGVANAYLDRSPLLAITAATPLAARSLATHQNLDLAAVYRPFTKATVLLDGEDTARRARAAITAAMTPRMGPVHLALPSDVATAPDRETGQLDEAVDEPARPTAPAPQAVEAIAGRLRAAERPVLIVGIDLDPHADAGPIRAFAEQLGVPVFVTPKAKGTFPEDHPLFAGVCAGVAADGVVVDTLASADLLVGLGFEPVESDKLWHHTMPLAAVGPVSIAAGAFRPAAELVSPVASALAALSSRELGRVAWTPADIAAIRQRIAAVMAPEARTEGLAPSEVTRCLRAVCPRETIATTDVGSVKYVVSQLWTTYEPLSFFESNGLSTMSYGFPAAMAAKLSHPDRPVLCTIGDGGFAMTVGDLETCVRERIHFVTVVFNDAALSLIQVAQERRRYPLRGVRFGPVDFAGVAEGLGAWGRRARTLDELAEAVGEGLRLDRPAVIDVPIDLTDYRRQTAPPSRTRPDSPPGAS